jgi:DNA-directed RNA polymerase subunit RPC12/RpoP
MADAQISFVCANCKKEFTKLRASVPPDGSTMCPYCDHVFVDKAVADAMQAFGVMRARFRWKG